METSRRTVERTYYLLVSVFWFGTALPIALSVLLLQERGMSLFQIGILSALYSATIVLLELPTGSLADALGRKRVAALAYAFIAGGSLVFLFSFSYALFVAAFVLNGIGRALASGALDAWFVDAFQSADPAAELQPALAKAGTFTWMALGAGTLLGSAVPILFAWLPSDGILTPLSMTVLGAACFHLLTLALTLLLVHEKRQSDASQGWSAGLRQAPLMARTAINISRRNPIVWRLFLATFVTGLALSSLEIFWQPHFASLLGGVEETNTLLFGLIMGGNFVVGIGGNLLATKISRRLKGQYALVCAIFQGLQGISIIGLALVSPVPFAMLTFWLVYLNMSLVSSPHMALVNREIPSAQRSSILSVGSLLGYLGGILGSAGVGYVAERFSIGAGWTIVGAVVMLSTVLYWQVNALHKESIREQAIHNAS